MAEEKEEPELCSYCAALFISGIAWPNGFNERTLNATITFIEYKGEVYGITCRHVVEVLEDVTPNFYDYKFTLTSGQFFFYIVCMNETKDALVNPITPVALKDFYENDPDIALFKLKNFDLYAHYTKKNCVSSSE